MIAFYDKDTDLTFKCYSSEESTFDAFTNEYYSTIYQLNFWNDEGIKTFLTESTPLGNFLNWNNAFYSRQEKQKSQLIFAFDKDILVGCALVTTENNPIHHSLKYDKYSLRDVYIDNDPLMEIEFIASNPHLRGKGYGTKVIRGIKNNQKLLTNNQERSGITAHVRDINLPSRQAFLKNKFIVVNRNHFFKDLSPRFITFYTGRHEKALEKE